MIHSQLIQLIFLKNQAKLQKLTPSRPSTCLTFVLSINKSHQIHDSDQTALICYTGLWFGTPLFGASSMSWDRKLTPTFPSCQSLCPQKPKRISPNYNLVPLKFSSRSQTLFNLSFLCYQILSLSDSWKTRRRRNPRFRKVWMRMKKLKQ